MFDLGNLRILCCINPRVLSFRGVEPQFLRGIFFSQTRDYAIEIHVQIVRHFLRQFVLGFGEY